MAYSTTTPTYPTSFVVYAGVPRCGSIELTSGSTTTAVAASNFTPAATGTRVSEIRCCSGPTTAPGGTTKVDILINDGANDRILDTFAMINATDTLQYVGRFDNLILPTGYSLKAVSRTTLTAGAILDFIIMGSDAQV